MHPTVSVIIPFYNRVDWLEEAVESVLSQTYGVYEIIIINDGSKEDMTNFLNVYGNKIKYIKKINGGPARARNVGIEVSGGDYIAFLDSDDIWLPQKLEKQIPLMVEQDAIWSHTSYETFVDGCADDETKTAIKSMAVFDGDIFPEMLPSCSMATPCIVVKGDLIRSNPMLRFHPNMRYGQDAYLWLNLAVRYEILAIDQILTRVRIHGTNAGLQARIQIRTRSVLWEYMKKNKDIYFRKQIPVFVAFAFQLSVFGTKILNRCEEMTKNQVWLEYIAMVLYIIPWIIFKMNKKR